MNVDYLITDEAVEAAHAGYLGPVDTATVLKLALPVILPVYRAQILAEAAETRAMFCARHPACPIEAVNPVEDP